MKLSAPRLEPLRPYDPWRARQLVVALSDAQRRLLCSIADACSSREDGVANPASCAYPHRRAVERLVSAGVIECVWFEHGALRGFRMTEVGAVEATR